MRQPTFFTIMLLLCSLTWAVQSQVTIQPDGIANGTTNTSNSNEIEFGEGSFEAEIDLDGQGDLNFGTGNLPEDMTITADGDIGIGTLSPDDKLHMAGGYARFDIRVPGSGQGTGRIEFSTINAGKPQLYLFNDNSGSADVALRSEGTTYFNGGNVGVGITSTETDLTVVSDLSSSISTKDMTSGNYWDIGIGNSSDNFKFAYDAFANFVAEIDNQTGAYNQISDERLKKNFEELEEVLPKLMQLVPTRYHFKSQNNADLKSWGFIAQEVEPIFPSFVSTSEDGGKSQKGLAYYNFSVLAIKAIQEQQTQLQEKEKRIANLEAKADAIDELKAKNEELEDRLEQLEALLSQNTAPANSETNVHLQGHDQPRLEQNTPNPFRGETQINYYLPKAAQSAQLRITDTNGQVLKILELQNTGDGQVNISTSDLPSGKYQYTLFIDGKVFATKQMVLTQ